MNTRSGLAGTEARVFNAYWQDGVLDLLAGVSLVVLGIGWLVGLYVVSVAFTLPLALISWPILRQRITDPRLGRVSFNPQRRTRMTWGTAVSAGIGAVFFGVVAYGLASGRQLSILEWIAPGIPSLLLAALALLSAEALRLIRFAVYGAVFTVSALIVSVLNTDPGWAIVVPGALVAANGGRLLAAFLHHFPKLSEEMDP